MFIWSWKEWNLKENLVTNIFFHHYLGFQLKAFCQIIDIIFQFMFFQAVRLSSLLLLTWRDKSFGGFQILERIQFRLVFATVNDTFWTR